MQTRSPNTFLHASTWACAERRDNGPAAPISSTASDMLFWVKSVEVSLYKCVTRLHVWCFVCSLWGASHLSYVNIIIFTIILVCFSASLPGTDFDFVLFDSLDGNGVCLHMFYAILQFYAYVQFATLKGNPAIWCMVCYDRTIFVNLESEGAKKSKYWENHL